MINPNTVILCKATLEDVPGLLAIEETCFVTDRLSRRSFRHHIQAGHNELLVAENTDGRAVSELLAYGLAWCHHGTQLARLYSLAVLPQARGLGLAQRILTALENSAASRGRRVMRLEVAKHNRAAIKLYEAAGYQIFGEYPDYYGDHSDALRMQKDIQIAG